MAGIESRGNGAWRIQVCGGYDGKGNKIRIRKIVYVDPSHTLKAQEREVLKIAAALETDYGRHVITASKKITVSELCEEFCEECTRKGLSPTTVTGYRRLFDLRIIPFMGKNTVEDVTPRTVSKFCQMLTNAKAETKRSKDGSLSGTTQLHFYRALHSLFAYAVRMQYIAINPVSAVEPPRKDTKESQFYELSDCARLLDVLDALEDEKWCLFFYLSIYTGMRPGEIIGLDWQDINIDNHYLTVKAGSAFIKGEGTIRTDRPKTRKSIRMIDLPDRIIAMLKYHKRVQDNEKEQFGEGWPEPDAVFTGEDGSRLCLTLPSQHFQRIVKANKLKPITLYGLRHTAATIMIAQGLNAREVAARLGHSQTSTTLNIYAHVFQDANTRATNAVVDALATARKKKIS